MRPSREWLPVFYAFLSHPLFYVALFLGFAWYWHWIAQTTKAEGWIIAYIAYPILVFVSLIPVAIVAIINQFISKKRISLNLTYIITYVTLNIWSAFDTFGVFLWIS